MVKGKHKPAPGAVRADKVLHPQSRKVKRLHSKEVRKQKLCSNASAGGQRIQQLGEKLLWFHDNLEGALCDENSDVVTKSIMLELANGYLSRFQDEVDQIKLKNSIGGGKKNKRDHYRSRMDVINLTIQTETDEFNGCGLEMPNLLDSDILNYFKKWNGELKFVQNIGLKRFRRKELIQDTSPDQNMEAD